MKIKTYIFAYNDERIIPYTMRHYTKFSTVVIVDNGSTDKTIETAMKHGASGMIFSDMLDELDDQKLVQMKDRYWKGIDADWIIVCDADEFIYHPDLTDALRRSQATIIEPKLWEMFSDKFPTTKGQVYEEIKTGCTGGNKMNIFRPSEIKNMNWEVGCHDAHPEGNVIIDRNSGILTLHMRYLSLDYVLEKTEQGARRLSQKNRDNQWSIHFMRQKSETITHFEHYLSLSTPVL